MLAIVSFAPFTLGALLVPRPVIGFAGYLGGRQKDIPNDRYVVRFSPGGRRLEFGSFVAGGTADTCLNEGARGLATDEQGNLYVGATVNDPAFIGTKCALAPHPAGNTESLILELTFAPSGPANGR